MGAKKATQTTASSIITYCTMGAVPLSLVVALFSGAALLRILVGYQPHSGQDNYHGAHGAYGGDFEAQRHWMELTLHLPIGEWYWYDLEYWGLDYPPLSAYQSWLCGFLSSLLVGSETVAFETSRGYEDPTHKAYMRGTVLVLDLLVYGTAAWMITRRLFGAAAGNDLGEQQHTTASLWSFAVAMSQPAILLIDHGHFQYNTTALGLSLWAFYFITANDFEKNCVVGSIFFCLALSFKQMTLYYAPVVGCYLLGRCLAEKQFFVRRFLLLGFTVIVCFAVLWWPFVVYGPESEEEEITTSVGNNALYLKRLHHVLRRIIPVQRGLFEGKVSNLWCALSVRPLRLKHRIPQDWQPILALAATAVLMAPSCYKLFRVALLTASSTTSGNNQAATLQRLLWGTTQCALAFFLVSFQVHEKSLLLALAPATILSQKSCLLVDWFALVTTWTLWPLLVNDRLQVAYICTVSIFVAILLLRKELEGGVNDTTAFSLYWKVFRRLSWTVMLLLHVVEALYAPPEHLPDLFPVLWSVVGCGFCCVAYLISGWYLFLEKEKVE